MIYKCATCGKEFDALWPDLYRYRRGGTFLCSWSCLRKYDEKKGSGNMARMKKDGTEAKRPGPKPKLEKVEMPKAESWVDKLPKEDRAAIAEKNRQEIEKAFAEDGLTVAPLPEPMTEIWTLGAEGYTTTAIKKGGVGEFYYDKKHGTIDWENEYGEEISLLPADWVRLGEEIPKMLKLLGVEV